MARPRATYGLRPGDMVAHQDGKVALVISARMAPDRIDPQHMAWYWDIVYNGRFITTQAPSGYRVVVQG